MTKETEDAAIDDNNPKPDTAQGVADLIEQAVDFAQNHSRTTFSHILLPGGETVPVSVGPNGGYDIIDPAKFTPYAANPLFRRGRATMTSLDSFIAHLNRFGDSDSAVFVNDDTLAPSLTAVLDYHRADTLISEGDREELGVEGSTAHGEYRHGLHRVNFAFPTSDEWKEWLAKDADQMTMEEFATFLENRVLDVAEVDNVPEPAERFVEMLGGKKNIADWASLVKVSKGLKVYENAVVSETVNLASGALGITLNEEHETEVGGVKVEVPTMFFIDIPIFREGVVYRLPVRLRWRKGRGSLTFFYELWGHDRAFRHALKEAAQKVDAETTAQVFYGSPEA